MIKKFTTTYFVLFLLVNISYSQSIQQANIKYIPNENGYELEIPFVWKFINCYGEVHVTITKNTKNIKSTAYIYNGVRYTSAELGNDAFTKPTCGLTDINADVYNQAYKLGNIKMDNVLDWLGGCMGQTYHVTKLLGLNDADFRDNLSSLSLSNIKIDNINSRDYTLEGKIEKYEKQKSLNKKLKEADNAYKQGNFDEAKKLYKEVLNVDYSNQTAKNRVAEIENKQKEKAFKTSIEYGDYLLADGDYQGAKSAYQKALSIKPDNEMVKNKIREIEEKENSNDHDYSLNSSETGYNFSEEKGDSNSIQTETYDNNQTSQVNTNKQYNAKNESERMTETALKLRNAGNIDAAYKQAQLAVETDPENIQAKLTYQLIKNDIDTKKMNEGLDNISNDATNYFNAKTKQEELDAGFNAFKHGVESGVINSEIWLMLLP